MLASGASVAAAKAGALSQSAGRSLGSGLSAASAAGSALADASGRSAARALSHVGEHASAAQAAGVRGLAAWYRWSKMHAAALPPALYVRIARLGRRAERYARTKAALAENVVSREASGSPASPASPTVVEVYGPHRGGMVLAGPPANDAGLPSTETGATQAAEVYERFYGRFWVEGVPPSEPLTSPPAALLPAPPAKEDALSLWTHEAAALMRIWAARVRVLASQGATWTRAQAARAEAWLQHQPWAQTKNVNLSQMMIIAGALLLICGGLLVGGALFLRAGAGTSVADTGEGTFAGVVWTFLESDRPLPERAVFTLSGTPASFRINGLSISGVNQSAQPLTGIEAVLKPDMQRPDLKLALEVDKEAVAEGDDAGRALDIVPKGTVPAHAPFRLVFALPPEATGGEDGITVEEFFESYGGLLLRLRYEVDGKQKTLIQYLPPELLREQLDEVAAEATGG